jgi:hypothetical protein
VTREGVQRLLSGQALGERDLFGGAERHGADAKSLDALRNFCDLRNQLAADGAAFVCYVREAYVHPHTDELRVTFDRRIQGRPYRRGAGLSLASPGSPADVPGVVLEIKFTNRFPAWLRQVAQDLGLVRRSLPKYVKCVDALQGPALGGPPGFRAVQARAGSMAR